MDNLSPIYRIEFFLDAIVNGSQHDLDPIYRVEFFLAKIAGAAVEIPQPLSRMEMFLAQLCGESLTLPTPQSRTEQYLAAICGEDVEIPPFPVYRIEYWLDQWAQGGGGSYITLVGDIVRFMASSSAPFRKLQIALEPIQELHGYDSPWPAGGSVQLLNIPDMPETTCNGVTYHIQNGVIYANGTCTDGFTPVSNISVDFASDTYTFSVQLLSGSVSGVNNSFNGYNSNNDRKWLVAFGATPPPEKTTRTSDIARIGVTFNNGAVFNNAALAFQVEIGSEMSTFRPYSNICPISGYSEAKVYVSPTQDAQDATVYTIDLDGTRYGGTLDVLTGVLTVDRAMVDLGTLDWYYREAFTGFSAPLTPEAKTAFTAICSAYPFVGAYNLTSDKTCGYIYEKQAFVKDYDYTDAATFKTAMSGVQLCYEIAQPIEITLTPQTINSIVGENNVWDDGTVTVEVKGEEIT